MLTFTQENFSFKMQEFYDYINKIKDSKLLTDTISKVKIADENKDFDLYSFIYFINTIGLNSNSIDLVNFALDIPDLLKTKSGREYFLPKLEREKQAIKHFEEIHDEKSLPRLLPFAYDLARRTDYTFASYTKKYIEPVDYEKFKAVCDWLRLKNNKIFTNSIDSTGVAKRNKDRLVKETYDYFNGIPLKNLNSKLIKEFYDSIESPYSEKWMKNHPLSKNMITSIYEENYNSRMKKLSIKEAKQLLILLKDNKSLVDYVDTAEYSYEQTLELINLAKKILADDEMLSTLSQQMSKQIAKRKYEIEFEDAKKLASILEATNFNRISKFYDYVAQEYGIPKRRQLEIIEVIKNDDELQKIAFVKAEERKERRNDIVGEKVRES